MKTKVMMMAAALGLLSHGIFAKNDGSFTLETNVIDDNKLSLSYTKAEKTDIRVKLIDETGFVVFDKVLQKNDTEVGVKLNISNLMPGNYTIISSSNYKTTAQTMNLARAEKTTKIVVVL